MSEPLDLFSVSDEPPSQDERWEPMTSEQRDAIRALSSTLGTTAAQEQFNLVETLVGGQLRSVADLDTKNARLLIPRLRKRVDSRLKTSSGNSWDAREEDTWIDNL